MSRILATALAMAMVATVMATNPHTASAGTRQWQTCKACPDAPEVSVSGSRIKVEGSPVYIAHRKITLGVPGRSQGDNQSNSVNGVAIKLPPAKSYLVRLRWDLHTWDSYNALGSAPNSGSGYWDAFIATVMRKPYWQSAITDPLTTDPKAPTVAMLWGGTSFGSKAKPESATNAGKVLTARLKGNPKKDNYLNIVLDTASPTLSDSQYPSWGTVTIERIQLGGVNVANPKVGVPFKNGRWAISNGYRGRVDHGPGGSRNSHAMFAVDMQKCRATGTGGLCTAWSTTNGAKVVSPVTGRVKVVKSSGNCQRGLIIDIDGAPGYRLGLWHVQPASGLVAGKSRVKRGAGRVKGDGTVASILGTVSPLTGSECGSANHIHMVLYFVPPLSMGDAGTQQRIGVPFDRRWAIGGGCALPDTGASYEDLPIPCTAAASQAFKASHLETKRR